MGRRISTALLIVSVLAAMVVGCSSADPGEATRLPDTAKADPLIPEGDPGEPLALPDPEAYGFPPLTTLQTNPGGVAEGLLARQAETTWSMIWQVRDKSGDRVGDMIIEHMPAEGSDTGKRKFHVHATIGTGDTGLAEVAILDEGDGPHWCARQGSLPWACDVEAEEADALFEFLSVEGFAELSVLLRQAIALPGLSVQYAELAGTPVACFYFPPVPEGVASGSEQVDIDLSQGGHFCLSTEGAPVRIYTPDLTITTVEYSRSVDADRFALPV